MEDLFVQLTRRAEGKKPRLNPREWSEVLQDVFELRRFIPVVSVHLCLGTIHILHIQYFFFYGFHLPTFATLTLSLLKCSQNLSLQLLRAFK